MGPSVGIRRMERGWLGPEYGRQMDHRSGRAILCDAAFLATRRDIQLIAAQQTCVTKIAKIR